MKKILVAALLVLVMAAGVLAAEIKIDGRVEYGFTKTGDVDAVWYGDPTARVRFFNDNFEIRLVGATVLNAATLSSATTEVDRDVWKWDWVWCHTHRTWEIRGAEETGEWVEDVDRTYSLSTGSHWGVKVDRANVKIPVAVLGSFSAGRIYFATSDWDKLGRTYDGLGWTGTFNALSLKALYDVNKKMAGGRGTYAFALGDNKLTVGGTALQVQDEDKATWAVDARLDVGKTFDVYGEMEYLWSQAAEDHTEKSYICGEANLAGFKFAAARQIKDEVTEAYVEKTVNNVILHAGLEKPDEADDALIKCWARYNF